MPGPPAIALLATLSCTIVIATACLLFFVPSPGTDPDQAFRENLLLGAETLATLVIGLLLMASSSTSSPQGTPKKT